MGEYATIKMNGRIAQVCKLGVMDDMRYVRRSELEEWAPHDAGDNTDCRAILGDRETLWRFPWPDEDGQKIATPGLHTPVGNRNMFRTSAFFVPAAVLAFLKHAPMWLTAPAEGSCGRTVKIACPGDERWFGRWSSAAWTAAPCEHESYKAQSYRPAPFVETDTHRPVKIVGERDDGKGNARTVFACGYCDAYFSLTPEEIEIVKPLVPDIAGRLKGRKGFAAAAKEAV